LAGKNPWAAALWQASLKKLVGGEKRRHVRGGVFDDWYMVPAYAVRRPLAKLLDVDEEDVSLGC
jgi:hypothetical protein